MRFDGQNLSPATSLPVVIVPSENQLAEQFITAIRARTRRDRWQPPSAGSTRMLNVLLSRHLGRTDRAHRLDMLSTIIGTPIASSRQLTAKQTYILIEELKREPEGKGRGAIGAIESLLESVEPAAAAEDDAARGAHGVQGGAGVDRDLSLVRQPDRGVGDLHEGLISRGKAQNRDQDLIFHRCNCMEVHHACHMEIAGGRRSHGLQGLY